MTNKKPSKPRVTNEMLTKQLEEVLGKLKAVQEWESVHEIEDNNRFAAGVPRESFDVLSGAVFNADGTEKLASKKDIAEVLRVFGNIENGAIIVQAGGKWVFRFLLVVAAVVAALTTIFGGWKAVAAIFIGKF